MNDPLKLRTPLWTLIFTLLTYILLAIILAQREYGNSSILAAIAVGFTVVTFSLIGIHLGAQKKYNAKNPENKIQFFGLVPPELRDDDEMTQSVSSLATRRVYIYLSILLPLFALIYVYYQPEPLATLAMFATLSITSILVYWQNIKQIL